MRIDDAIKMLRDEKRRGAKSVILAYWTAEFFGRPDDDEFLADSEYVESEMDWSADSDAIDAMIDREDT